MRRILVVVLAMALMLVMMVAMAAPAFAQAQHFEGGDILGVPADCQTVATPSGRENAKCSIKEPGNNEGGSGGGGANVDPNFAFLFPGIGFDPNAQLVQTPSGNQKLVGHDN